LVEARASLSRSPLLAPSRISGIDVLDLLAAGGDSSETTIAHLAALDAQGVRFTAFATLIETVRERQLAEQAA